MQHDQQLEYVCPRVRRLMTYFAKSPQGLQHLLLHGSPGSGKTSSTNWLLRQIWGDSSLFSRVCFILNAADERSLEAIRAKCIPFIEVDWRDRDETRPRFLVLDECETLTESAQLALRPLLDHDPRQLCVIFLSNTLNRVHSSIRSACLRIRFNPPPLKRSICSQFYRGDLRALQNHKPTFLYVHRFLNQEPWTDYPTEEFASSLIFLLLNVGIFGSEELDFFKNYCNNQSFEYLSPDQVAAVFNDLYISVRQKIDTLTWTDTP